MGRDANEASREQNAVQKDRWRHHRWQLYGSWAGDGNGAKHPASIADVTERDQAANVHDRGRGWDDAEEGSANAV